jgi:uncharacterized protein YkwD
MRHGILWAARILAVLSITGTSALADAQMPREFARPIGGNQLDQQLFNEAVLFFSNAARRQHGRAPLAADPALVRAASDHASNMARLRTHAHVLPVRGQQHLRQRMQRQSVSFRTAAENIAMDKVYRLVGRPISMSSRGCNFTYADNNAQVPIHTYGSIAQQVVSRWMASPKHRESLLPARFQRLGAGVGVDPSGTACGDLYLVQNFAD